MIDAGDGRGHIMRIRQSALKFLERDVWVLMDQLDQKVVCAVPAPLGFRLRVGFPVRAAGFFAFVSAQNELTGDSRMSSL